MAERMPVLRRPRLVGISAVIWPNILTPDGRRAWAFMALVGAGMVFTLFAGWAVFNLRGNAAFSFWLGVLAHGQIFMVLGALSWVLGRRMLASATRDGVTVDDRHHDGGSHDQP